jgi:hypothetical protein
MAIHVQIEPRAEALRVSAEFAEVLDEYAEDFEIRYCGLEPNEAVIGALRAISAKSEDERLALARVLAMLESGEGVELLYSA